MSRKCTVCTHDKRDTIDAALVDRKLSYRDIASKYGLTSSAVHRHAQKHLPETLAKAHGIEETASADKLLHRVESLITESEQLLDYGTVQEEVPGVARRLARATQEHRATGKGDG